jgi:uncharacterized damage-inducible protein DinB
LDAYGRIRELVSHTVSGLSVDELGYQPAEGANSIGWLVWHLTRVQDDHLADAAGSEQVWTAQDWHARFGLPFEPSATGYGQSAAEVSVVRATAELLAGYHEAVFASTERFLAGLGGDDLARVVDESWDPPVTLGARLVSVLSDDLQHIGQAGYLRGLLPGPRAAG